MLLVPYLFLMALGATIAGMAPHIVLNEGLPGTWFSAHIAVALATYALLTLAAITGLAIFIKERALKKKQMSSGIAPVLPSIADCEKLQGQLLGAAVIVLVCGLVTGIALQNYLNGHVLEFDHKTRCSGCSLAGKQPLRHAGKNSLPIGARGIPAADACLSRCEVCG